MSTINNHIEFVYLFDVVNGNPNGDPDAQNAPRQDYETGFGLVSDVCVKRKVRNYVETLGGAAPNALYITEGSVLDDAHKAAWEEVGVEKKPKDGQAKSLIDFMCKRYYDVRMFGALMQGDYNCGKVRGPVQIGFAKSIEPIVPVQISLTRMASTKAEEGKENKTMGNKWIVPYGLYRLHGYINAPLAGKSGATEADLALFWEALREMWHLDKSAARPEMNARALIVTKHPHDRRSPRTPELSEIVKVERVTDASNPARAWSDYRVTVNKEGVPTGVNIEEMI